MEELDKAIDDMIAGFTLDWDAYLEDYKKYKERKQKAYDLFAKYHEGLWW